MKKKYLLTDPFLLMPTENSVKVVWFSEFAGEEHRVIYGNNLEYSISANTTQMTKMREDEASCRIIPYTHTVKRLIWRHEAQVNGLTPGKPIPYQVISYYQESEIREEIKSDVFTLTCLPSANTTLKILLTSDHQLKPNTAANLQKVVETVGQVDAVFFAGDLVNTPDRASEWFDDNRGNAFFPCLQGRASFVLEKQGNKTTYVGGKIIQCAPIFPALGNHEVMGRFSDHKSLNQQFDNTIPRSKSQKLLEEWGITREPKNIKDNSFNTDSYEEIFSLQGKHYYALTFGDIRLIVLAITNMWRAPNLSSQMRCKYQEREEDLNHRENWGYGQFIFESMKKGSIQYQWLEQELQSQDFKQAKYKLVMFHHPVHTLGGNIVPPYTDPIQKIKYDRDGSMRAVYYEYPQDKDYIIRDLMPLLESAGVQLVFYGHSHLWNRFISSSGVNFLESSNVGNSYGANIGEHKRLIPRGELNLNYAQTGDANGLQPVIPTIAPLIDTNNQPLPYIASNDLTVFSILDTGTGIVSSYRFDTPYPNAEVIKFDEFRLTCTKI